MMWITFFQFYWIVLQTCVHLHMHVPSPVHQWWHQQDRRESATRKQVASCYLCSKHALFGSYIWNKCDRQGHQNAYLTVFSKNTITFNLCTVTSPTNCRFFHSVLVHDVCLSCWLTEYYQAVLVISHVPLIFYWKNLETSVKHWVQVELWITERIGANPVSCEAIKR